MSMLTLKETSSARHIDISGPQVQYPECFRHGHYQSRYVNIVNKKQDPIKQHYTCNPDCKLWRIHEYNRLLQRRNTHRCDVAVRVWRYSHMYSVFNVLENILQEGHIFLGSIEFEFSQGHFLEVSSKQITKQRSAKICAITTLVHVSDLGSIYKKETFFYQCIHWTTRQPYARLLHDSHHIVPTPSIR